MELKEKTVAELVAEDFRHADVFKKYDIDFCCGGKVALEKICADKHIDLNGVVTDLEQIHAVKPHSENFSEWSLSKLIHHIVDEHHQYIRQAVPVITQYAEKVAKVHGQHRPEVVEIRDKFIILADELLEHLLKEERILFPAIELIENASKDSGMGNIGSGRITHPIMVMENDHREAGEISHVIRELSNNFTPPEEACNTYRVLYFKLEEFISDLHKHIHLENNILFPKAIAIQHTHLNN